MENQSTHFIFDGEKIIISPDLHSVVSFLQEIEKEVESFLNFDKKLESIKKQHLETIKFIKENSANFKFNFSEHPATIAEKLKIDRPIRSEMIVLFANLETLFCLNIAYENKISDEKEIIKRAMDPDDVKDFLERFCLNQENKWYQKNTERLKYITADDLRKLRNSLTHFFSVTKNIGVSHAVLDEKARKLEKATNFRAKFISPEDLYEIIKGSARLMIKRWNEDCKSDLAKSSNEFREKILSVKTVVDNYGAMIIKNKQINI